MICFHSGTAVYRGVPLKKVLKLACGGILPECKHLEFIGADTYFKYVPADPIRHQFLMSP